MESHFRRKIFSSPDPKAIVFFGCPFGVSLWKLRWAVKGLQKQGFTVVAYEFNTRIFLDGNPARLPEAIQGLNKDTAKLLVTYKDEGIKEFGVFGASLGGFMMFNLAALQRKISWGVFITAGNVATGIWKFPKVRKAFEVAGYTCQDLESSWKHIQYPDFGNRHGHRFIFVGSERDRVVPLGEYERYLKNVRKSGVTVEVIELQAKGHGRTALQGLRRYRKLISQARA